MGLRLRGVLVDESTMELAARAFAMTFLDCLLRFLVAGLAGWVGYVIAAFRIAGSGLSTLFAPVMAFVFTCAALLPIAAASLLLLNGRVRGLWMRLRWWPLLIAGLSFAGVCILTGPACTLPSETGGRDLVHPRAVTAAWLVSVSALACCPAIRLPSATTASTTRSVLR